MRARLAFAAYLAITIPVVSPLIDYSRLFDASYGGDSRLLIWTLAWDARSLLQRLPLFDANLYFPEPASLRYAEHHIGLGLAALPFQAGGPVFAYWCVWLIAFPLNGLAMYALAWRVVRDRRAAFVAGLIYAFCFFRMHHAHGHLQLLWTWPLPLVPVAVQRWLEAPSARTIAALAALLVFQALVSWYLAVLAGIVAVAALVALLPAYRTTRRHWLPAAAAAGIALPLLAWLALPYLSLRAGGSAEAAGLSADLKGYLVPPANTWLGRLLPGLEPRLIWGEQTIYAGITTIALAAAGIAGAWRGRSRVTAAVIGAGLVGLALSFGPASGWSPYDLLSRVPGFLLLRSPARLALLVMLAVAVLAAYGVVAIGRRLGRTAPVAITALSVAILAEAFVVDFPAGKPVSFPVPPVYTHLASLPPGGVLSLPSYRATPEAFRDADYLLFSTAHWMPIVNGYGRQEPPAHGEFVEKAKQFPASESVELLRRAGVRYVILNAERASELRVQIEAARRTPGVEPLGDFAPDVLFRILP